MLECSKYILYMGRNKFSRSKSELLWVKLCPQRDMLKSLFLVPVNVILFKNSVIADVIN